MRKFFLAINFFLPWFLRRIVFNRLFNYEINRGAYIGFAWVDVKRLTMGAGAKIGHMTVIKGLDNLEMGECSSLGRLNWVSGYPKEGRQFFIGNSQRDPSLYIGSHSSITHRHILDCSDSISIGSFVTVAGYWTQILTHSIDVALSKQMAKKVEIGDYSFVGTRSVILPGACIPRYSLFGAGSVLNKKYETEFGMYGGVPAKFIKKIPVDFKYFSRNSGAVS